MEKRAGDIPFRRQLLSVLSRPTRRSGVRVWHKVERKRYSDGRTALRDGCMLGVARARIGIARALSSTARTRCMFRLFSAHNRSVFPRTAFRPRGSIAGGH
jgi:hypothetical protein